MIPRNTPATIQDVPILQWANGRTEARPVSGGRFAGFVGFHSEANKDTSLDLACTAAHIPLMELRHPRPNGQPAIVTHWAFGERVRFYPITAGPPATTISGCLRYGVATADAGLGLAWPAGEKSRLAVRGLVIIGEQLVLLQLSVKSTMTDYLLTALIDHIRACEVADGMIKRDQHPEVVALHELCLPLTAGAETSVGKEETALITPLISAHPAELDKAYISSCWRSKALHDTALDAWPGIQVWAAGYRSGETNGDSHLDAPAPAEEAPPAEKPLPQGVTRKRMPIAKLPL